MKKFRKAILPLLCFCLMLGVTGCGSNDNRDDQAPIENNMNDATENTQDHLTEDNGGVIDDIGDAVGEGINDIGDGVEDLTDDLTGDYRDNQIDSTEQQNNR